MVEKHPVTYCIHYGGIFDWLHQPCDETTQLYQENPQRMALDMTGWGWRGCVSPKTWDSLESCQLAGAGICKSNGGAPRSEPLADCFFLNQLLIPTGSALNVRTHTHTRHIRSDDDLAADIHIHLKMEITISVCDSFKRSKLSMTGPYLNKIKVFPFIHSSQNTVYMWNCILICIPVNTLKYYSCTMDRQVVTKLQTNGQILGIVSSHRSRASPRLQLASLMRTKR